MRCDHCGMESGVAFEEGRSHCAPPFTVQLHAFNGKHPADKFEADEARKRELAVKSELGVSPLVFTRNGVVEPDQEAAKREFIDRYSKPLDTSKLGPIRDLPSANRERARQMREAIRAASRKSEHRGTEIRLRNLAATAGDEDILTLWRFCRNIY